MAKPVFPRNTVETTNVRAGDPHFDADITLSLKTDKTSDPDTSNESTDSNLIITNCYIYFTPKMRKKSGKIDPYPSVMKFLDFQQILSLNKDRKLTFTYQHDFGEQESAYKDDVKAGATFKLHAEAIFSYSAIHTAVCDVDAKNTDDHTPTGPNTGAIS